MTDDDYIERVLAQPVRTPQDVPDITLVEFLRARLDEDERIAQPAGPSGWEATELDDPERAMVVSADRGIWNHIVRHDPARVLREVEAKRRVIGYYEDAVARPAEDVLSSHWATILHLVMRQLAAVYRDHPDYRAEEWASSS